MCFQLFSYSPVSNTEHMPWQDVFVFLRHVLVVRSGLWLIFHKMLLSRRFLKCCYYAVFVTGGFYTSPCKWKLMTIFFNRLLVSFFNHFRIFALLFCFLIHSVLYLECTTVPQRIEGMLEDIDSTDLLWTVFIFLHKVERELKSQSSLSSWSL